MYRTTFGVVGLLLSSLVWDVSAQQLPPPGQASQLLQQAIQQNPGLGDQIASQIQSSGLTPDQVRQRLEQNGYPSNLLDPYMGAGQPGSSAPAPGASELAAMRALGLSANTLDESTRPLQGFVQATGESIPAESLALGNYVFGVDVFRRTTSEFLPLLSGPVPQDYQLGAGDQVVLILSGDIQAAYTLRIAREGFVLIPQVGQLYLANLTLDQALDVLYSRLSKLYSSVGRDAGAKTHLSLSVASVRVNQIYVVGEVKQPGAYEISALGTAMTALYAAGGVTRRANMREIEIRRHDQVVATLDLYDYLLRGEKRDDIRLETGDVVFVRLRGKRAQVTGAVLRPAIYELKPDETLPVLLRAAGGFAPEAALERVAIYRIVPVPARGTGPYPRSVVSVSLPVIQRVGDDPPPTPTGASVFGPVFVPGLAVEDGDSVVVDSVPGRAESYYVAISGAVRRAGRYPWREGMTLRELLTEARGPGVGAYLKEAEIARLPADRSAGQLAQTIRVPLDSTYLTARDSAGRFIGPPGQAFPASGSPEVALEPYDNVLILKQPAFSLQSTVYVGGEIRFPGDYALISGQDRLTDIIDRAGGLTPLAFQDGIRFMRTADGVGQVDIDLPRAQKGHNSRYNLVLQDGDSIYIPEFQPSVKVSGAVNAPGSIMWQRGRDVEFYVNAAGGANYKADMSAVRVHYANGTVRTRNTTLLVFHADPAPAPGSEVIVPMRDTTVKKPDLITTLGVVAQVISSIVTLAVVSKL